MISAVLLSPGVFAGETFINDTKKSTIHATPTAILKFEVASPKFNTNDNQLTVSITVDRLLFSVSSGISADQSFQDKSTGAAYFGYYLSTGVRSVSQSKPNISIKLRRGSIETAGRTYYHLENESVVPTHEKDLMKAPQNYTTFVKVPSNSVHCGPRYAFNGLSKTNINCNGGTVVTNMDLTQFVKVLYTDPIGSQITSQIEFTAVAE